MNVSAWSIRNPIPAVMLFVMLTLVGVMSFKWMKIQQFPDIDLPTISIVATLPGAAPAQMETEVARKIENAVATLQGIKHIYTKVQDGTATVTVEFRLEKTTQEALDEVRDGVSRIRSDLPGELRDPVISRVNLAGAPILTYTVASSRMDDEALSWFVDNSVTRRMLAVRGVGAVARVGGVDREVRVELDPQRMLAIGVTAAEISHQLRQVQSEASGGRADIGGAEQSVRTLATVRSAEELAAIEVPLVAAGGCASIRWRASPTPSRNIRSTALLNGKQVVGFEITRSRGAGEVDVAEGVRAQLEQLKADHPDIQITEAFNFVDPVEENFTGSMMLLIEGAVLAVIVVWLFLRDWRATLVSATALPLSIIPAFAVMYLHGLFTQCRHPAVPVAGGRHSGGRRDCRNRKHHSPLGDGQDALSGRDGGCRRNRPGRDRHHLYADRGVPAHRFHERRAGQVLRAVRLDRRDCGVLFAGRGTHAHADDGRLFLASRRKAKHADTPLAADRIWHGRHGACVIVLTTLAALGFFFGSFALVPLLPTGFLPPDDLSQTQVYLTLPPGSTFKQTLAVAEDARHIVEKNPHVKLVYTAVGGGAAGSDPFAPRGASEARKATLTINLTPRSAARWHQEAGCRA